MRLTVVDDAEAVARHSAEVVAHLVAEGNPARPLHVALAGGTTPERCHELLAELVDDWSRVHVWLSDERAVPPDDPDANFAMVRRSLLDRIDIAPANVHRVLGELGADAAADAYERELREQVVGGPDGLPLLDVVMCGMGPDGHTCSLFPGRPEAEVDDRLVVPVHDAPKPPPDRVSFTLPLLHAATRLLLLVSGEAKRAALDRVRAGADPATPASMLRLGALEVVADRAAAPDA
jgi:6-phosphogluconolactonase